MASPIGFHVACELISVACLSGTIFPIFLVLWFGVLTLILERGRSVFDRFSWSVPCLVRPGLLQNVVRAARHSVTSTRMCACARACVWAARSVTCMHSSCTRARCDMYAQLLQA